MRKKHAFPSRPEFLSWGSIILTLLFFSLLSSCRTQKQVPYLQGRIDSAGLNQLNIPQPVIQKGDLLSITIFSDDPAASAFYNQQAGSGSSALSSIQSTANTQNAGGYLVDAEGNILFQSLGAIKAEGQTTLQLSSYLKEHLKKYLNNPYAIVRFLNYKITVLGEVAKQGVYTVAGENITLLELLGQAGDITMYGIKEKVTIIRQNNGQREIGYIDLTRSDAFASPYFNLMQNDVVVVSADPRKPNISDQVISRRLTWITAFAAVVTSISVIINLIR